METTFANLAIWISNYEATLSGVAAALAISGIMSTWCVRLVQSSGVAKQIGWSIFKDRIDALPYSEPRQSLQFCQTDDGCSIAYASSGRSPDASVTPMVRSLGWFSHLEAEWAYSQGRALWTRLGEDRPLFRYDGRGIGMSPRVDRFDVGCNLKDLEAVVDATGSEQVVLFGLSEGGLTAIQYAAKHPERVSHLILYGTLLGAQDMIGPATERWATLLPLMQRGWGADEPICRQLFTSIMLPDGNRAQNHYFNEMQRASCDGDTAFAYITNSVQRDATAEAASLSVPTLVFHRQGDLSVPLQCGERVAQTIPDAEFKVLPGNNHWMLALEDDTDQVVREIEDFIARH